MHFFRAGVAMVCLLLVGCDREPPTAVPAAEAAVQLQAPPAAEPALDKPAPPKASAVSAPRRGYGPVDMKLAACASLENDHVIAGKACPSGTVVFGPYVGAPDGSDVEVVFEMEALTKLALGGDIVSNTGQQLHGALLEQVMEAGTRRKFGYRVRLFHGVQTLESRITLRTDSPADFKIRDLVVNVR